MPLSRVWNKFYFHFYKNELILLINHSNKQHFLAILSHLSDFLAIALKIGNCINNGMHLISWNIGHNLKAITVHKQWSWTSVINIVRKLLMKNFSSLICQVKPNTLMAPLKPRAILNFSELKSIKYVQSFIVFTSYFCKFI